MAAPEPFLSQAATIRKLREELFGGHLSPETFATMVARGLPSESVPGFKFPRFRYSKVVAWIEQQAGGESRGPGRPRLRKSA
jgi:hypothetical protein